MEVIMIDIDANNEPSQRKRSRSFGSSNCATTTDDNAANRTNAINTTPANTGSIIITTGDNKKRIRSSQHAFIPHDDDKGHNPSADTLPSAIPNVVTNPSTHVVVKVVDSISGDSTNEVKDGHISLRHHHQPQRSLPSIDPLPEVDPNNNEYPSHQQHRVSLSPPPAKQSEPLQIPVSFRPPQQHLLPSSTNRAIINRQNDIHIQDDGTTTSATTSNNKASSLEMTLRYRRIFILPIITILFYLTYYWPSFVTLSKNHIVSFQQRSAPSRQPLSSSSSFRWFRHTQQHQSNVSSKIAATTSTTILVNRNVTSSSTPKPLTLRQVVCDNVDVGFHLATAPAFFGFYGYFGMLSAWYEGCIVSTSEHRGYDTGTSIASSSSSSLELPIRSVVGASAGAMAAILIAAGITPRDAMTFCANITVDQYADFPGLLSLFRGNLFEKLLQDFLISAQRPNGTSSSSSSPILFMEDAHIPVAVTAFDIQTMTTQTLFEGSMARAARASATFPGLFQPVGWTNYRTNRIQNATFHKDFLFIDGGVMDIAGTMGLEKTMQYHTKNQRVINLCVGSFKTMPGPEDLPHHPEVISISMTGLPQPGPWAMGNGPIAYDVARKAMLDAMDIPLQRVDKDSVNKNQKKKEHAMPPHYHLTINV